MNYTRLPIPIRLVTSKEAIIAVLNDTQLSESISGRGYPEEELAVGLGLQEEARNTLQSEQQYRRAHSPVRLLSA